MSRRNPRTHAQAHGPRPGAAATAAAPDPDVDSDAALAEWLGERLRRVALGATAALIVARAYWPGDPDYRNDAGSGLFWVFAVIVVAGLGVAAWVVGGTLRFRFSWADAAFLALVALVGASASHAVDRRPAINLAWEWGAVGFVYVLARNLPRTRGESTVLVGAIAAAAVALSAYGLFQVGVELPEVQRKYRANPAAALALMDITPGSQEQQLFESRLLGSNEPYATFGLANSLAGFLVAPLVVMLAVGWETLTRRDGRSSRWGPLLLGVLPAAVVLVCLTFTKSRSAYLGLSAGLVVLAARECRRVPLRWVAFGGLGALVVAGGLATAGIATGRLDREVLTHSGRSLRFRREYWVGTWAALNESPRAFWAGFGPGNFSAPYALHKLPEASEDIHDPHNFILETWSTAGLWAVLALTVAVGFVLWNTLAMESTGEVEDRPSKPPDDPGAPPASAGWLLGCAGLGCVVALPPIGALNPFEGDLLVRWLILGAAWALAVAAGALVWNRRPLDSGALGAAVVAVLVNLLAAGGLSVPAVALALWVTAAVGLNLREDRGCGRLREFAGRLAPFGLAVVWVALLGTFVGAVTPHWKVEAALAHADDALKARPPRVEVAEQVLEASTEADRFSSRVWQRLAAVEYQVWRERGSKAADLRWRKVPILMLMAVTAPRPTDSWSRHRQRALMTSLLLKQLGGSISPMETTRYRADVVQASRKAVGLYPTNASLRAWLAEASAEIGMTADALKEGREAVRLDALTPHQNKKLDPSVRQWLGRKIPEWEKSVADAQEIAAPKPKGPAE